MKRLRDMCGQKDKEFRIINSWTHTFVEKLNKDDALKKYGNCIYHGGYTSGYAEGGGFETTVFVDVWGK